MDNEFAEQITAAMELVIQKMGFLDRSCVPTYLHPLRVGLRGSYDPKVMIVGFLHDIIEDTDVSENDLYYIGFDKDIVEAVIAMTHPKHEPYVDYAKRVAANAIARQVKVHDVMDNRWRLEADSNLIDDENSERMLSKWQKIMDIIEEMEDASIR
jgi:(p)ppGpp synthase/HD superfamily hydrolase